MDLTKLCVMDDSTRTRNNGAKLKCRKVYLDCTKFFFTNAVIRDWNRSLPSVAQCNSIASLENNLDHYIFHLNVQWVSKRGGEGEKGERLTEERNSTCSEEEVKEEEDAV